MFDEQQRLRDSQQLVQLLSHYAGSEERETWFDRIMSLEATEPKDLTKLHGELLAHGWVEMNTGAVPNAAAGACPRCYRATVAGRRALRRHHAEDEAEAA